MTTQGEGAPKAFAVGQRWRWLTDGCDKGKSFTVRCVSAHGEALWFDQKDCLDRFTQVNNITDGSLEYLGMAGEAAPVMGVARIDKDWGALPVACLECGGDLGSNNAHCRMCFGGGFVMDNWAAWQAGARDFPRKPKPEAPASTVAPPGSRWRVAGCGCVLVASALTNTESNTAIPVGHMVRCQEKLTSHWGIHIPSCTRLPDDFADAVVTPCSPASDSTPRSEGESKPRLPSPVRHESGGRLVEVSADGRNWVDIKRLKYAEPADRYAWRRVDGVVAPDCPGMLARAREAAFSTHRRQDWYDGERMRARGSATPPPPAPAPWVGPTDFDLLEDA